MFAAALVVGGCTYEDRYEIVAPQVGAMEELAGAQITPIPALLPGLSVTAFAAWSPDRMLFGSYDGRIMIWENDLARRVDIADVDRVTGLVCHDDGSATAVTREGRCSTWNGQDWQSEIVEPDAYLAGLDFDAQGRPLVYSRDNRSRIWRREATGWTTLIELNDEETLMASWSHPVQGVFYLSNAGRLFEVGPDGITITPLEAVLPSWNTRFAVAGDGATRLAVLLPGSRLLLGDDGTWTGHDCDNNLTHILWHGEELLGIDADALVRWDGTGWTDVADEMIHTSASGTAVIGDEILVCSQDCEVAGYDGTATETLLTDQRGLYGIARVDGALHLMTGADSIWRLEDEVRGAWGIAMRPASREYLDSSFNHLIVDDRGRLVVVLDHTVVRREGGQWTELDIGASEIRWAGRQDDEILVLQLFAVTSIADGGREAIVLDEPYTFPKGVARAETDAFYVVASDALVRASSAGADLVWAAIHWHPRGITPTAPGEFIIHGYDGTRRLKGGKTVDMTPYFTYRNRLVPLALDDVHVLADGRVLAWGSGRNSLCLREGPVWRQLTFPSDQDIYLQGGDYDVNFVNEPDGTVIMFGGGRVLRLDLAGVPGGGS